MGPTEPAVALVGIVKRFGTSQALDGASLVVRPGAIHALLGENGAGKTTLMRIVFGMVRLDSGQLRLHGRLVTWHSPAEAIAAGIGMVHQHFTLVPAMTVAENVELGTHARSGWGGWRLDRQTTEERVRELGRASGLEIDPRLRVSELSVAAQQRVEILKALSRDARILILDEPTAVLAPREIDELLRWLRTYAELGGTAILITHKLREALAVADDVTVLRRGQTVFAATAAVADERVLTRAMIGDDPSPAVRSPDASMSLPPTWLPSLPSRSGAPVATLDDVVAADAEHRETIHATVSVNPGEILGIAGVEGAGQHALLRVLAGRVQPVSGTVTRSAEVGFVPEDRQRDALVLEFSLA
jgi:general nucleoside transport system ATP-binding protein